MSSHEDVVKAVYGAHTVYLVTNFWETMSAKPEIVQGKIVTDACKEAGVTHLIFSSLINASKATEGRLVNITHFDGKAKVEEYIRESGIPASFVMPGIFMSELFSVIRKQDDGSLILAIPVPPETVAPFIDASIDTGEHSYVSEYWFLNDWRITGNFVRAALQHPPADNANVIYASSNYYSFEKIAADFESVTGIPLKVVTVPGDMFKSFLAASLPPDMVHEIYENLILLEGPGYYAGADLTRSLELLSEKPVTVREFIEKNREHWGWWHVAFNDF